jgi:hypothetical protein
MWAVQRTWEVFTDEAANNGFVGYEYAADENQALAKTIVKHGAPEKWGIEQYTIKKIKWAEEDI